MSTNSKTGTLLALVWLREQIVLTFLGTQCPTPCDDVADKLARTASFFGPQMPRVAFIAISVEPEQDTPQAVRQFSTKHQMTGVASSTRIGSVYVIDQEGRERVLLTPDFQPSALAVDLQVLMKDLRTSRY